MTILGPVLIAGFLSLAIWMTLKEPETQLALVVDETHILNDEFVNGDNVIFSYTADTLPVALSKLESSPYTAIVYIPGNILSSNSIVMHYKKYPSFNVQRYIANEIEKSLDSYKIKSFNLDKETYERIKDRLIVNTVDFKKKQTTNSKWKLRLSVSFSLCLFICSSLCMVCR